MAYITPRVLIKQEFEQVPIFVDQPLASLIIGPQYNLYRYSVAAEKPATYVGTYDAAVDTLYSFPGQVAGTAVDTSYVKVMFDNAHATFYPTTLGSTTGEVTRLGVPNTAKYYNNRFKATNLVFKTANGVDRSTDFSGRNVKLGDLVTVNSPSTGVSLQSAIKALHPSKSDPVLGTVTTDTDNKATQVEDYNNAVVASVAEGSVATVTNTSAAYKGAFHYITGTAITADTLTATVTTGGNISAVRFTVTSLNGAFAPKTAVAATDTDNLVLDAAGTNDLKLELNGSTSFEVGDSWAISVVAPVDETVVPTAAGTYTGASDLTYKLTVVRGGPFYTGSNSGVCARIAVSSNNVDSSATVNVPDNVAFKVGSHSVTATFASAPLRGGLIAGDIYYIPATAAAPIDVNIVETYDSLPTTLLDGTITDWVVSDLSFIKDIEVNQSILDDDVDLNWEITDQTITINSGIVTFDSDIVVGITPFALDVTTADVYIEHRDLVNTNSVAVGSVNSISTVEAKLGTITPDNPIAQAVYDAILNSAGVVVYYATIATDDIAGYTYALGLARKSDHYYSLVPLTLDKTIQDVIVGHVNAMSTPEIAKWRIAWLSIPAVAEALTYDLMTDGDPYQGTITDDPLVADTQNTLVTVAGAKFVTDGVRPTDKVLINFRTDANGETVYDEYVVVDARTETTLVVATGPAAAINVPTKVQIQRVYTTAEQAATLAAIARSYDNRRVRVIFPDTAKNGTVVKPGYFLAAALAGLRSGVVPHQGLTNSEILGVTDLTKVVNTFSEDDLNTLAEGGVWVVTQAVVGATPYARHQLTTAMDSLNTSEDSITTNVDSISYALQKAIEPFIGQYNVNPTTLTAIRNSVDGQLHYRATSTFTARAGNQLIGYTILKVEQDATFKDRVNVDVRLEVPYPVNFVVITLLV